MAAQPADEVRTYSNVEIIEGDILKLNWTLYSAKPALFAPG